MRVSDECYFSPDNLTNAGPCKWLGLDLQWTQWTDPDYITQLLLIALATVSFALMVVSGTVQ